MATSPTQLCLRAAREQGYTAQVVERWNGFAKIRQDLFGFIDVLVLAENKVIGVQCTSYSNISARKKKILEHVNYAAVKKSGIEIRVQGWHKINNRWQCKEIYL